MNTSTLLHVRPGKLADKSVVEAVMKAYPTVFGFAVQHENELVCEQHETMFSIEQFEELDTGTKDGNRIYFFGNWPTKRDIANVMPFAVTNEEGANIMALIYEGNFEKWATGENSGELFVADEILYDQIGKVYDAAGQDFDKFWVDIKGSKTQTLFKGTYTDRGWFAFLPYKGDPHFLGANALMKGFDWGTISNPTGVVFAEEKKEEPKKSGLGFLNRKKASVEPEPEVKPVKDPAPQLPVPPAPEIKPPGTDTTVVFTKVKVPPQLQGGVRNAWIRLFYGDRAQGLVTGDGELPGDHQSKNCEIDVHPSLVPFTVLPVSDTKSMKTLKEKVVKGLTPGEVVAFKSTTREPASNYTGTASETDKNKTLETWIKFLDAAAKKRPSPIELQKEAAKRPPFSESFGIDRNELLLRSRSEYLELFDGNQIAADVAVELQQWLIQTSGVNLEQIAAGAKGEEPEVTKTVEQAAPASGDVPAKKSSLGFLRGKKAG